MGRGEGERGRLTHLSIDNKGRDRALDGVITAFVVFVG